ncbi:MAG: DUF3990 domain-containing protein [Candidatus Ancillula sp.]|jgi:hypothetical protein|nr:DUF3990 domain-containing protein [Candidatus Ancillula sp.]
MCSQDDFGYIKQLFHGSVVRIDVYDISLFLNDLPVDFGNGFYTTPKLEEALAWGRRKNPYEIVLNEYDLDIDAIKKLSVKVFKTTDFEWFNFVLKCRKNNLRPKEYDLIIGPVAAYPDYELMQQYDSGDIDKKDVEQELKLSPDRFTQVVFCTEVSKAALTLLSAEHVKLKGNNNERG